MGDKGEIETIGFMQSLSAISIKLYYLGDSCGLLKSENILEVWIPNEWKTEVSSGRKFELEHQILVGGEVHDDYTRTPHI